MKPHPKFRLSYVSTLVAALAAVPFVPMPANAAAPFAKAPAPAFYRVMVGDFEVTVLSDGTIDLPVDQLLKESAAQVDKSLAKSS